MPAGQFFSISHYIQLKNFATVNDLVTITAVWENGGEDWTLIVPDPIVIEASGEKLLFISVQAPESAAGSQATLKIRAESGGDPSVYDEATLTFRVDTIVQVPPDEPESSEPELAPNSNDDDDDDEDFMGVRPEFLIVGAILLIFLFFNKGRDV